MLKKIGYLKYFLNIMICISLRLFFLLCYGCLWPSWSLDAGCICFVGYVWLPIRFDPGDGCFLIAQLCICYVSWFCFPYQLMAEERGLLVDVGGFNEAMDEARERSRNAQNKVWRIHIPFSFYTSPQLCTEVFGLTFFRASQKKENLMVLKLNMLKKGVIAFY